MTLLTHMPSFGEFMVLVAVITAMVCFSASILALIVALFLKKKKWKASRYAWFFLKFFLISTVGSTLIIAIVLLFGAS
jgi:hypothetical protein